MAITRCPYCRAIIDEKAEYCSNCGTQLLFPEDESAEEEIPGEKIVDDESEEKDYDIDEPPDEESKDLTPEDEEEAGDDGDGGDGEEKPALLEETSSDDADDDDEEDEEEEVILVDDAVVEGPREEEKEPAPLTPKPAAESGPKEIVLPFPETKNTTRIIRLEKSKIKEVFPGKPKPAEAADKPGTIETAPEPSPETIPAPGTDASPEPAEEAAKPPMTFDTRELDKIGITQDAESDQLDKILEVLQDKQPPKDIPKPVIPSTDSLPPWAGQIKEPPGDLEDEEDREEEGPLYESEPVDDDDDDREETGTSDEPAFDIRRRAADSGIGLPERPTQDQLSLERAREKSDLSAERKPAVEETLGWKDEKDDEADESEGERPAFHLTSFLKAKSFDVLFVGVFWLVSLWLASRSMDVSLFQVLSVAGTSSFVFFGVLLVSYFFLFYFFLKETLGDRLFRERD